MVCYITDAAVFNESPVFGLQARVSEEEAQRTSETAPLKMAFIVSWDGAQVCAQNYTPV